MPKEEAGTKVVEPKKESGKPDNPSTGGKPNASGGKPSDQGGQGDPNQAETLEKTVKELAGKLDTVNRQYKGSTEEALRLKSELDTLTQDRDKLREVIAAPSQRVESNDAFQSIVEKEGLHAAIGRVVDEKLNPLSVKVDKLSDKDVDQVYNTFTSAHPGLKDDALTVKFDKEFERLKGVYDTVEQALDAAYAVVGGAKADQEAKAGLGDGKKTEVLTEKSKKEKELALKAVSEEGKDKKDTPEDPNAALKQRIESLKLSAATKEVNGRDARDDWATISELERQLKSKSE